MKNKILLLGGAGFIGNRLTRRLLELNYDVEVIDALWFGNNLPNKVKLKNNGQKCLIVIDSKRFLASLHK